ncbi:MAG: hypothetical protein CVU05_03325 [Bacteroidetes bacterium HGW-Bacteroidetes-21]|jgi:serine phosphatase RsbU (regulator of sigma subunit)|nr:MAG: hypothetical protein CVU05_03325 [Bacteroidetes bacterium HGW-Bacteroidetes-21]
MNIHIRSHIVINYFLQGVLLCLIFLISISPAQSQNTDRIDSLTEAFKMSNSDTAKINTLFDLFNEYQYDDTLRALKYLDLAGSFSERAEFTSGQLLYYESLGTFYYEKGQYDKAIIHYNQMLAFAQQRNDTTALAQAYNNIGSTYDEKADYEKALTNYFVSLELCLKIGNRFETGTNYSNIGLVYYNKGDFNQAWMYYLQALKIFEELNDAKAIAKTHSNLGMICQDRMDYPMALLYYNRALETYKIIDYKRGMSGALNNMGIVYFFKGEMDKALYYYTQSLTIASEIDNKHIMCRLYGNIGLIYKSKKMYEKALYNQFKALEIKQDLGEKKSIASSYNNIGNTYTQMGNTAKGVEYCRKCIEITREIQSLDLMQAGMNGLSQAYFEAGDYRMAYIYKDSSFVLNDSVYSSESANQIAEMQTKYETEKKEQQIELQKTQITNKELEVNQQKTITYTFILGFVLMLILAGVIYKNLRDKKKANILLAQQKLQIEEKNEELNQQNEEIQSQRDEIEAQRDLVTVQKNNIERIHEKLTSSIRYAELIQKAVLPDTEMLQMLLSNHFILYKPRDIVSGDFYWTTIKKNVLWIAVADCTGHGVPGAFMSMLGISFLNEMFAQEENSKPSQMLEKLRGEIIKALKQKSMAQGIEENDPGFNTSALKDGMDISLVSINLENNQLEFAGANSPLYIIKNAAISSWPLANSQDTPANSQLPKAKSELTEVKGDLSTESSTLVELKGDKMPIAIHVKMQPFTDHSFTLQAGDTIYLFSDGYADQFGGPAGKKFMASRFRDLLVSVSSLSMEEQKETLEKAIEEWKNINGQIFEQTDDITVVGVRL